MIIKVSNVGTALVDLSSLIKLKSPLYYPVYPLYPPVPPCIPLFTPCIPLYPLFPPVYPCLPVYTLYSLFTQCDEAQTKVWCGWLAVFWRYSFYTGVTAIQWLKYTVFEIGDDDGLDS